MTSVLAEGTVADAARTRELAVLTGPGLTVMVAGEGVEETVPALMVAPRVTEPARIPVKGEV